MDASSQRDLTWELVFDPGTDVPYLLGF